MKKSVRRLATAGAASSLVLAGMAVLAPTAEAASYGGQCGAGYQVRRSINIVAGSGATVFLTYSAATGKNCVVTVVNSPSGPDHVWAWVSRADGSGHSEDGEGKLYTYYAGPVYVSAPGQCVNYGGGYQGILNSEYGVACG